MPSLSSTGLIALRAGSYEWPVNGSWRDLTTQVGPQVGIADGWWFSDRELCYAQVTDQNRICTIHLQTGEVTTWDAPGPNILYAGGRVWASKGAGGYWDSWGPNPRWAQTAWTPYAVDNLTGAIALLTADWDFCVYEGHEDPLQASLTVLMSGVQEYQASFANGVLTLYAGENWHHWTAAVGLTYTGHLNRVQMDPGGRFCNGVNLGGSYFYGQVVWADWTPEFAIQMPYVNNYNAKVYRETPSSPIVQVIGSRGPAELPGEQQVFTIDWANGTLDGQPWTLVNVTQPPPEPPVPPIPPDPPIPPVPPVVVEDFMQLPTLERSRITTHHPDPAFKDRWVYYGADGRLFGVNDEGYPFWDAQEFSPSSSFVWVEGATIYTAPRNGVTWEGKVNLDA